MPSTWKIEQKKIRDQYAVMSGISGRVRKVKEKY
jgi:hypothetical protein